MLSLKPNSPPRPSWPSEPRSHDRVRETAWGDLSGSVPPPTAIPLLMKRPIGLTGLPNLLSYADFLRVHFASG
jgi:hypothetical protein